MYHNFTDLEINGGVEQLLKKSGSFVPNNARGAQVLTQIRNIRVSTETALLKIIMKAIDGRDKGGGLSALKAVKSKNQLGPKTKRRRILEYLAHPAIGRGRRDISVYRTLCLLERVLRNLRFQSRKRINKRNITVREEKVVDDLEKDCKIIVR